MAEQTGLSDGSVNYRTTGSLTRLNSVADEQRDVPAQARQNLPPLSDMSLLAQAMFDNLALAKPVNYATATLQVSTDALPFDAALRVEPPMLGSAFQDPPSRLAFDLPWSLVATGLASSVSDGFSSMDQGGSLEPAANRAVDVIKPSDVGLLSAPGVQVTLLRLPAFVAADQDKAPIDRVLELPVEWVLAGLLQQQASERLNAITPANVLANATIDADLNSFNSLGVSLFEDALNGQTNPNKNPALTLMPDELAANQAALVLRDLAPILTEQPTPSTQGSIASLLNPTMAMSSLNIVKGVSLGISAAMPPLIPGNLSSFVNSLTPASQMTAALPVSAIVPAPIALATDLASAQSLSLVQTLGDSTSASSVNPMAAPIARSAGLPVLPFTNAQRMAADLDVNKLRLAASTLSDSSAQLKPIEAIMAHNNQVISQALGQELSVALDEATARAKDDSSLSINSLFSATNSISAGAMERPVVALPAINYAMRQAQWETALGQRLMYVINQQVSQAQIQLNPAHLGPIRLMINFDRDQTVQIQMLAQHSQTKDAMEQALPRLRDMLNEAGIKFDQLQVSQDSADNPQQGMKQNVMGRVNTATLLEDTATATEPARSPIASPHTIDFYV